MVKFDENTSKNGFPEPIRNITGICLRRDKMAKRASKGHKSQTKLQEFVVVTFAADIEEARDYETLLKNNDIPATIKEQHGDSADDMHIAVMVPEDFLDEAHVVIESQDAYDDFYDFAFDEDDEGDFDRDIFGDDF